MKITNVVIIISKFKSNDGNFFFLCVTTQLLSFIQKEIRIFTNKLTYILTNKKNDKIYSII